MYKIGDIVYNSMASYNVPAGTRMEIVGIQESTKSVRVRFKLKNKLAFENGHWAIYALVSEEIFNSPLYQALKED